MGTVTALQRNIILSLCMLVVLTAQLYSAVAVGDMPMPVVPEQAQHFMDSDCSDIAERSADSVNMYDHKGMSSTSDCSSHHDDSSRCSDANTCKTVNCASMMDLSSNVPHNFQPSAGLRLAYVNAELQVGADRSLYRPPITH